MTQSVGQDKNGSLPRGPFLASHCQVAVARYSVSLLDKTVTQLCYLLRYAGLEVYKEHRESACQISISISNHKSN